jgi:hypothetical protein
VSEWRIKLILDFELEMTNAKTYCDADPFNCNDHRSPA